MDFCLIAYVTTATCGAGGMPIEEAWRYWKDEDWEVPTGARQFRGKKVQLHDMPYQWRCQRLEYKHQSGMHGHMANSERARHASQHMLFACPGKDCGYLVRSVTATRVKNARVLAAMPPEAGSGKARKRQADKLASKEPLRVGDGCMRCSKDRHKGQRRRRQLKI